MDNESHRRRSGPRMPIQFPIALKLSPEGRERPVRVRNMGSRGVAFYSDLDLKPATRIEVILSVPYEISLRKNLQVRMGAEVVRVDASPYPESRSIAVALCPTDEPAWDALIAASMSQA